MFKISRVPLVLIVSLIHAVLWFGGGTPLSAQRSGKSAEHAADFGNIWIERIRENASYRMHLFEDPRSDSVGEILVQCFLGHSEISITVGHPDPLKNMIGVQRIMMWSDKGEAHDLIFYGHFSGAFAIALGQPGGNDDLDQTVTHVLAIFERAERFVAYSIDGKTATIDAMHLPAARVRFRQLCTDAQMPKKP
jgi:hypothetical protein